MPHITGCNIRVNEDARRIVEDPRKTFNKAQKVVSEVNESFRVSKKNKEDGEDDEKCQWFIVSLMRLVQKNI